jgi:integrase
VQERARWRKVEELGIEKSFSKTRHFRAAHVCQTTLQAIKESLQPGQAWLFPGRSSGHLSTNTVLRTIDRLAEEAGIPEISRRQKLSRKKVTPHILRHRYVVNALMAGVPVPMIQKPGGAQEALHDGDLCHRGAGPW